MKRTSKEARNLASMDVIIWDEAPMAPKQSLEAIELLLQDIIPNNRSFGGKTFILGGDFRQILPIVEKGSRHDQVNSCLKRSTLWPLFIQFRLHRNMRVTNNNDTWKNYLLDIGNG